MKILDIIANLDETKALSKQNKGDFVAQDPLSLTLCVASSYQNKKRNIVIVTPSLFSAQTIYELLEEMLGKEEVLFYPFDEVIRIGQTYSSKEMLAQRLFVMSECLKNKTHILITHLSASSRNLPSPILYENNLISLIKNKSYNIKELLTKLIDLGFLRVNKIDQPLQFASRGDILDVFPINFDNPVRIEFFDDEIESMRQFDIGSQISQNVEYEKIEIFPSNEYLYDKNDYASLKENVIKELNQEVEFINNFEKKESLIKRVNIDLETILTSGFKDNLYPYYNFINGKKYTIFDYLKVDTLIYYDFDKMENAYDFYIDELNNYFNELYKNGLFLKNIGYFEPFSLFLNKTAFKTYSHDIPNGTDLLPLRSINYYGNNILTSLEFINRYFVENKHVLVAMDKKSLLSFENFLKSKEITNYRYSIAGETEPNYINLLEYDFKEGFEIINQHLIVLTKKEVFGYHSFSSRYVARYKKAEILTSYEELNPGDYVVHEQHGIGRFLEITTLTFDDEKKDYLKIEYANNEILYVPLEKFYLIRKYVGSEGSIPKISRIGGSDWKKTKKKIESKISDITDRLISIYAEREGIKGFTFEKDDEIQKEFEAAFPFPLTQDQAKCVTEIKKDMESIYPMDRILCGDVGFGKTEVAFRAAFKAILSHKQVVLLCPTTILAKQHYEVALNRFSSFGVKIALFSRFIPESVQNAQIKKIKNGEIHLIIGTHRLLSKDIVIPNLGLLIVDEEQRFGVEHKERIKEISKNIDVLTLSATPIPRTLQMSLMGIRQLSMINSAPLNRMPVQTYVMPFDEKFVFQIIERELSRGGQVFYLHNLIGTIYQKAKKIQEHIKGATVGIVHSKLDKDDIEEIMDAYYQNKINVLVCTSIIETGLDVTNANTIIIEDADRFGLAQLYQIKGRVGRSYRVAYAYLFFNKYKELNEKASKRLKAIKEFTELGSGYKIAQRDLNIRGAGDILGSEQSGFVDTIGMNLYLKIIEETLDKKKGIYVENKVIKSLPLSISGYIPSSYASDEDKIQLYQQIQDTNSIVALELVRRKIRDIYGRIPKEVETLLTKRKIDILADSIYVESIKESQFITLTLSKEFSKISKSALLLNKELYTIKDKISAHMSEGKIVIYLIKDKTMLENLDLILEGILKIGRGSNETR